VSIINAVLTKFMGTKGERDIKRMEPMVQAINALEPEISALTDDQLTGKTAEFRTRIENGEQLDDLLLEAFAVAREAGKRVLNMRHFDVQLMGGMVLHEGKIAEMKTGEGKTLVSTLPGYLNALSGNGVHVVTVNDYLAGRDSEWMGKIYRFLGLNVGVIQHDMGDEERQQAYGSDVTYGTNNEFGFDYLRDNMKFDRRHFTQHKGHNFAIVDEVDSILIDEARTPLIISGPSEESVDKYYTIDQVIPRLNGATDYEVDEKHQTAVLTDEGIERAEKLLNVDNLYDPAKIEILHHLNQSLRAHTLYHKDKDYVIKEGQVVIVDEFTGRMMPGRRWSDGLHQAVEAKEKVKIEKENQTLATITFQNYFRMYDKLAGMTGTADTEAAEFDKIYRLEVVIIPTNRPLIRIEHPDVIYRTVKEKYNAVVEEIKELQQAGQPVLVGTISIENSETLSALLKRRGVRHNVLNARFHDKEAEIVAQAGAKGAVTIATNMAGRGTDILLGGNPEARARERFDPEENLEAYEREVEKYVEQCAAEKQAVIDLGGLHILGTERHESRRIDNQLRGRAGRQGDPGSSRFYLSLEDDLMRIFASERVSGMMQKLGMEEGVPIEANMVSKAIERAQKQVEGHNFDIRKHLLEYDDVNNAQRTEIYGLRREILEGKEQTEYIRTIAKDLVDYLVDEYTAEDHPEEWDLDALARELKQKLNFNTREAGIVLDQHGVQELKDVIWDKCWAGYQVKEQAFGDEMMRLHERMITLQVVDKRWKDHLYAMDHLKEGIGLRGYGQRDPLTEYKRESFEMFGAMKERLEDDVIRYLFHLDPAAVEEQQRQREEARRRQLSYSAPSKDGAAKKKKPVVRKEAKVGRNSPCPCGSGKKYKKCCGA
jgi:preprotein translocase subunit SecA